ncbi:MAG: DUF2480 family protein [Chitinophagales bacterium]|tara:strand:+ start:10410 stop:10907 length:498 start_codon:yes stop_codon:yes gene_type:complete
MENKVAKKAIETIDMLQLISVSNIKGFDLKPFLYKAIILKEKDFRDALKDYDFQEFKESQVYIHCSSDAIIPVWAYMLLASYLTDWDIPHIFAQNQEEAINLFISDAISELDVKPYTNKRVVIKGCGGKISVKEQNYVKLTQKLKPVVRAISYGEACSMVPISKN